MVVVECSLAMHLVIFELPLIIGAIRVGQFSITFFEPVHNVSFKFPAILIILNNIIVLDWLLLFGWFSRERLLHV